MIFNYKNIAKASLLVLFLSTASLTGCDCNNDDPVDDAIDDLGDSLEDAGDEIDDALN